MKKTLKKVHKDYRNVLLYATSEATVNQWCTDYSDSNVRIHDSGTVKCN